MQLHLFNRNKLSVFGVEPDKNLAIRTWPVRGSVKAELAIAQWQACVSQVIFIIIKDASA